MVKLALVTQSFIGFFRRKNFFYKLFNSLLAFFLIFSLAFVTIETVDPEPVFAASWDCFDSSGRPIAFQTKYDSGNLQVKTYNFSTNTESKAGYATVVFPIFALLISTLFEGYEFGWLAILGIILVISGNIMILKSR